MDLNTILIGLTAIAICIAPFILSSRGQKEKGERNASISQTDGPKQ